MEKLTVVKPEVKVEIEQKISQQDVIELVAYKQIKKLETQKTEVSNNLEKVNEKLKDTEKKYNESVLKEVTKLITPFLNVITTSIEIKIVNDCSDNISVQLDYKKNGYPNSFTLDKDKLSTVKSKTHVELEEKRKELNKTIIDLTDQIQKIKNDKNSIKNAITEQLLLETDEGKSLLSLVENAYKESFPKLLK